MTICPLDLRLFSPVLKTVVTVPSGRRYYERYREPQPVPI